MNDIFNESRARAFAEKTAVRAFEVLETATDTLDDAVKALKAEEEGAGEKAVVAEIKALNAALLFALKMQEAARAAGSEEFGLGHGPGALDLGAARDEIGLRLACLRAAAGGGTVSGGAE